MDNKAFSYHFSFSFPDALTQMERIKRLSFFNILRKTDTTDWPIVYNLDRDTLVAKDSERICTKCQGFIYRYPRVAQEHILSLSKALSLNLRIHHFITGKTCEEKKVA